VVGVWGQGDAIIPFADFDGRQWRSSWPAPTADKPDPTPLSRIPAAWWGRSSFQPTWEIVEPTGHRRITRITGTDSAGLGSGCSVNLALKTDVPAETYGYGAVLAANHAGVIEPVQALTSDSTEWATVSALLPGLYRRHEATAWSGMPEDFLPDMRAPIPGPRLDAAFTSIDEQGEYLYFESYREFARRPDQLGDLRSFITGWLWRSSPRLPFQAVIVEATTRDGDGKGALSFHPLGVVRHGTQRFWLGGLSGYASGGLVVLDVRSAGIKELLSVGYPGC
jgi:hypothetical protein